MLELKNVTKIYPVGGEKVEALRGVSLRFRKSEFVSVLGPSGCGKTTLLNIIGGLDRYTDGDLSIKGRSTKEFRDRDWDAYRNHSVGFVFQSYNLIPHQSVLQNVELSMTLAGVSRSERRKRAIEALKRVGLSDQLKKRPTEMSGGQMQRVAIARAIVNDPDIVLADEPTGALDTETSVQVLDILKEIAKDRLVIMVTHNPELAEKYSTRIVRMLDGKILSDSDPCEGEEEKASEEPARGKKKKPSMSFATSFGLSLKNLFTKKGRTALVSFAGSIGIIGIALIYAVSHGMTSYIDAVQEDTLSSYPLTIEATHIDASSLITAFMGRESSGEAHGKDAVYQKAIMLDMLKALSSIEEQKNDLKAFKAYIEDELETEGSPLSEALSGVSYSYDADLLIYTKSSDGKIMRSDPGTLTSEMVRENMGMNVASGSQTGAFSAFSRSSASSSLWRELVPDRDGSPVSELTKKQYDIVYGRWPESFDEAVLFLDSKNEISDLSLYALGLKSEEETERIFNAAMNKEPFEYGQTSWSYETVCAGEYRVILSSDCYTPDAKTGYYTDLRETETGLKYLYDNGLVLRIVGIARPSESAASSQSSGGVGYTVMLTDYIIEKAASSDAAKAQTDDPGTDIFTGLPFRDEDASDDESKAEAFRSRVASLDTEGRAKALVGIQSLPDEKTEDAAVLRMTEKVTREDMEKSITEAYSAQTGIDASQVSAYIAGMSDEDLFALYENGVREQFRASYARQAAAAFAGKTPEELSSMLDPVLEKLSDARCALLYDTVFEFSDSTLEDNLKKLGCADPDSPSAINLYAATFENKDVIKDEIEKYNGSAPELKRIRYTDYVGLIMSSVTTIINAITYVLIAFVAVSLFVSSIMIGVITLISVQERTKEIGILRAIGASKRNVSGVFFAETVMIGFAAGVLGVLITYLLCIPLNIILHKLTGISTLSASLPPQVAVVLILVSMALTLVAGLIPSKSAARKDPVAALRTE